MATYNLNINGKMQTIEADSDTPILWVLRDTVGLVGTKYGCGIAMCGACTVASRGTAHQLHGGDGHHAVAGEEVQTDTEPGIRELVAAGDEERQHDGDHQHIGHRPFADCTQNEHSEPTGQLFSDGLKHFLSVNSRNNNI